MTLAVRFHSLREGCPCVTSAQLLSLHRVRGMFIVLQRRDNSSLSPMRPIHLSTLVQLCWRSPVLYHHVWRMVKTFVCLKSEVCRKSEVVIGGTSDETFDVHVKCPFCVSCECNVLARSGETGSPPPKPIVYLFRNDEDIGGGGIALQALLLTSWVCTRHASSCSTR